MCPAGCLVEPWAFARAATEVVLCIERQEHPEDAKGENSLVDRAPLVPPVLEPRGDVTLALAAAGGAAESLRAAKWAAWAISPPPNFAWPSSTISSEDAVSRDTACRVCEATATLRHGWGGLAATKLSLNLIERLRKEHRLQQQVST